MVGLRVDTNWSDGLQTRVKLSHTGLILQKILESQILPHEVLEVFFEDDFFLFPLSEHLTKVIFLATA